MFEITHLLQICNDPNLIPFLGILSAICIIGFYMLQADEEIEEERVPVERDVVTPLPLYVFILDYTVRCYRAEEDTGPLYTNFSNLFEEEAMPEIAGYIGRLGRLPIQSARTRVELLACQFVTLTSEILRAFNESDLPCNAIVVTFRENDKVAQKAAVLMKKAFPCSVEAQCI